MTESLDMGARNSEFVENSNRELTPFVPQTDIQYAWDATALGYAKRCPRLYQYTMIEGWRPQGENHDIRFGSEFHLAQSNYQKFRARGIKHDTAVHHVIKNLMISIADWWPNPETKSGKYKNRVNLLTAVIGYLDVHENDAAKTVILENGQPAVEQRFYIEMDYATESGVPYAVCGYLDKIVEYNGEFFDVDYKTTTRTPGSYYWDGFEPDNQMTMYTFASRVITPRPAKGVIIDSIQVLIEDPFKFTRGITYRTEDQLEEWLNDLRYWITLAEQWALNGYWPMNDTACDKYGGCPFRKVCSSSPQVREMVLNSDFEKGERWNPLLPR